MEILEIEIENLEGNAESTRQRMLLYVSAITKKCLDEHSKI